MSETPAAHLARLRVEHGARWRIDRTGPGGLAEQPSYIAAERSTGRRIVTASLAELQARLERAGWEGRTAT
jgi:hypothetical protein